MASGQQAARPPTTDSKLSGDDAVAEGLAAFGAASLQGKHFGRDIKIIGNRFSAGVTPKRDQMMASLEADDWDKAFTLVAKLTEKAAALAAHQQALSDFEALLFRWEDHLNIADANEELESTMGVESGSLLSADDSVGHEAEEATDVDDEGVGRFTGQVDEDVLGVYTQPVSGQAEALALSPEEAVLAKEAAAKMAVIAKEQTALVLAARDWLAQHTNASTEELRATCSELQASLLELEPEHDPEESHDSDSEDDGKFLEHSTGEPELTGIDLQHAILLHFYAEHAPKTSEEVSAILQKRLAVDKESPDGVQLSQSAFDKLCNKLEDKYGESPQSKWALDAVMSDSEDATNSAQQDDVDWAADFDDFEKDSKEL